MDVAIVGAGIAGLAAARVLAERGFDVELVEATDRLGGRIRTVRDDGAELPAELGPEFVHGDLAMMRANAPGAPLELDEQPAAREGELWQRFASLARRTSARDDESVRDYIARAGLSADDARLFAGFVEGFYGAPLDDISAASVADDRGGIGNVEPPAGSRPRGGYATLVGWLVEELARLHVTMQFETRVTGIAWNGDGARVWCGDGEPLLARRVLVTLPVSVLRGIAFEPALVEHAAALDKLAMGHVVKLVLCMREPVWPEGVAFLHTERAFPTFWMRSRGATHQLIAWAGGPHALALAGEPEATLVERALDDFAAETGVSRARLGAAMLHAHFHDYERDPNTLGAYSYTRVGGRGAADVLVRPLDDTVYFAGEATDAEYEGTVTGALASGVRAARRIELAATATH